MKLRNLQRGLSCNLRARSIPSARQLTRNSSRSYNKSKRIMLSKHVADEKPACLIFFVEKYNYTEAHQSLIRRQSLRERDYKLYKVDGRDTLIRRNKI